jgi:hypothetical protein
MATVVAVHKKTRKPYIKVERDPKMPYMANVRRDDKQGDYQVYWDAIEFLPESKQYDVEI